MIDQDPATQLFAKEQALKVRNKLSRACDRANADPAYVIQFVLHELQTWQELLKLKAQVPVRTNGKKLGRPRTVDALRNHFDYEAAKKVLGWAESNQHLSNLEKTIVAWIRGLVLVPKDQLPTENWTQDDIKALAEWNILPERFVKH